MVITLHRHESRLNITLNGKLDAKGAAEFRNKLLSVSWPSVNHVALNFAQVDYLSSHGIGTLAALYKKLGPKGIRLEILGASAEINTLLSLMQLQDILSNS